MFWKTWQQRGVGCPTREDGPGAKSDQGPGTTVPLLPPVQSHIQVPEPSGSGPVVEAPRSDCSGHLRAVGSLETLMEGL